MLLHAVIMPPDEVQAEIDRLARELREFLAEAESGPWILRITGFGNLTTPDAQRLTEQLAAGMADVEDPPVVRFAHPVIGPDGIVKLGLEGDVDALVEIARWVPHEVEQMRLYVDRRRFWPAVFLGRVTSPSVTLDGFADWVGSEWTVDAVTLVRRAGDHVSEHARLRLGA